MFALFHHAIEHGVLVLQQLLAEIQQILLELLGIVGDLLFPRIQLLLQLRNLLQFVQQRLRLDFHLLCVVVSSGVSCFIPYAVKLDC